MNNLSITLKFLRKWTWLKFGDFSLLQPNQVLMNPKLFIDHWNTICDRGWLSSIILDAWLDANTRCRLLSPNNTTKMTVDSQLQWQVTIHNWTATCRPVKLQHWLITWIRNHGMRNLKLDGKAWLRFGDHVESDLRTNSSHWTIIHSSNFETWHSC